MILFLIFFRNYLYITLYYSKVVFSQLASLRVTYLCK